LEQKFKDAFTLHPLV